MVTLLKPSGMFNEKLEILADDLVLLNDKMCVTYCLDFTTCKNIMRYNIFRTQQKMLAHLCMVTRVPSPQIGKNESDFSQLYVGTNSAGPTASQTEVVT